MRPYAQPSQLARQQAGQAARAVVWQRSLSTQEQALRARLQALAPGVSSKFYACQLCCSVQQHAVLAACSHAGHADVHTRNQLGLLSIAAAVQSPSVGLTSSISDSHHASGAAAVAGRFSELHPAGWPWPYASLHRVALLPSCPPVTACMLMRMLLMSIECSGSTPFYDMLACTDAWGCCWCARRGVDRHVTGSCADHSARPLRQAAWQRWWAQHW